APETRVTVEGHLRLPRSPTGFGRRRQRPALFAYAAGVMPAAAAERRVTVQIHPSLLGLSCLRQRSAFDSAQPSTALSLKGGPDGPRAQELHLKTERSRSQPRE